MNTPTTEDKLMRRDMFAAFAMTALIARDTEKGKAELQEDGSTESRAIPDTSYGTCDAWMDLANGAFEVADAMLAASEIKR